MKNNRQYSDAERNTLWQKRIIPALILGLGFILVLALFRFSFFNATDLFENQKVLFWSFRIISITIFLFLSLWIFYELAKAFVDHKYFAILLSLILILNVLLGPSWFTNILLNTNTEIRFANKLFSMYLISSDFGINLWVILLSSFVFFTIRIIVLKNNFVLKELFIKTIYFLISLVILNFFLRSFILFLTSQNGLEYILLVLIIAMSSDIGGFFGGRFLGHKIFTRKLAPTISPKKTIEGALVGYFIALFLAFIFIFTWHGIATGVGTSQNLGVALLDSDNNSNLRIILIVFAIFAPLFAITGDLFFSLIKRKLGIKDFSKLLLDHGGILDRVDSIATIFAFLCLLLFLQ
ncbi:phosphatidate cytidylyltransferase [Mycoplasma buteonis]|uniref:phosphatidate cytidylyltransferase n=1 Tax=Mycoplasma buteonis TaxID=171280 RepID=UPI00055BC832|nr:phosphatidate cytidylyltransferase [Mycoplasma buteonis]